MELGEIENDAVAAAGEWIFGAGRGCDDFLCITAGICGGAVVEGRLLRGPHGLANMLGHLVIEPAGRPCNRSLSGCLKAYAGASGSAGDLAVMLAPAVQLFDAGRIILCGALSPSGPNWRRSKQNSPRGFWRCPSGAGA